MKGNEIMIAVIDYGAGNLQSVVKAFGHIGCECEITNDIEKILNADGAVLPGVGSFGDAMNSMRACGADKAVKEFIATGKPFLGICLGLQLLFSESEESQGTEGLSLLEGTITKIPNNNGTLKIPHMGWNSLKIKNHNGLFRGIEDGSYVYFVHSYFLKAKDDSIVSSRTEYGTVIDASVSFNNIMATQFHPEKSGKTGLQMLNNFKNLCEGKEVL